MMQVLIFLPIDYNPPLKSKSNIRFPIKHAYIITISKKLKIIEKQPSRKHCSLAAAVLFQNEIGQFYPAS